MTTNILKPEQLVELKYLLKEYDDHTGNTKTDFSRLRQLIEYNDNIRKPYIDRMIDIINGSTNKIETYQRMAKLLYEMKDILIGEILNSDPSSIDQKVKRIEQLLQKCPIDYMNDDLIT